MRYSLFFIFMFFVVGTAWAGDYVCYDGPKFAGHYQSAPDAPSLNCFRVPQEKIGDYRDLVARNDSRFLKVDGDDLLLMTRAEMDAIIAQDAINAKNAELARLAAVDTDIASIKTISIPKVEAAIDSISNLNDAKVFLKRLCRYLASRS